MAIIDNYSRDELCLIVSQSTTLNEVVDKLGYSTHTGNNRQTVKKRIEEFGIDCSHFVRGNYNRFTDEDIFVENSPASQKSLREHYKEGSYSQYVCSICGQEPFWNGKPMTLILDHINGTNHDDRLENLRWVCPNCNQQLETTGYKKMRSAISQKFKKKYYCIDCGTEIGEPSVRCSKCHQKYINDNSKLTGLNITRDTLKKLIRAKSFVQIGEIFNVTDNTIRKWCDRYNLPKTKKEIRKYTDEEWELI